MEGVYNNKGGRDYGLTDVYPTPQRNKKKTEVARNTVNERNDKEHKVREHNLGS